MKIPLTPLEFAGRTSNLYGDREAVVDGDLRLTYEQFHPLRCMVVRFTSSRRRTGDALLTSRRTHSLNWNHLWIPQIEAVLFRSIIG